MYLGVVPPGGIVWASPHVVLKSLRWRLPLSDELEKKPPTHGMSYLCHGKFLSSGTMSIKQIEKKESSHAGSRTPRCAVKKRDVSRYTTWDVLLKFHRKFLLLGSILQKHYLYN